MKFSHKLEISFVTPDGSLSEVRSIQIPDLRILAAEQKRKQQAVSVMRGFARTDQVAAVAMLVEFIRRSDPYTREMLKACYEEGQSRKIFQLLSSVGDLNQEARTGFLSICIESGHHIRREVGDDVVLLDALRQLLPRYEGSGVTLYRGEPWRDYINHQHGVSWSSDREAAVIYARGLNAAYPGGGVLLESSVSADAILSAAQTGGVCEWEHEYLVDRRKLTNITVLERFPEIS